MRAPLQYSRSRRPSPVLVVGCRVHFSLSIFQGWVSSPATQQPCFYLKKWCTDIQMQVSVVCLTFSHPSVFPHGYRQNGKIETRELQLLARVEIFHFSPLPPTTLPSSTTIIDRLKQKTTDEKRQHTEIGRRSTKYNLGHFKQIFDIFTKFFILGVK